MSYQPSYLYEIHLELQRAAEKPHTASLRALRGVAALFGVIEFVVQACLWNGWFPH